MILITGAGGKTGKAVIKALVARGAPVRAFVRSSAHEAALTATGVREVVAGAMDDADSVSRAVRGADAVYHISPNVSPYEAAFAMALATYELVGTPPLDQIEIAEAFGRALNKPIRAEAETIEAWQYRAHSAGMDDHQRETLTKMFRAYARDGLKGNPNVLGWLLGRPPTSLASFAARTAAAQA